MSTPTWSPVDDATADLLTVLADDGSTSPSKAAEWASFVDCLKLASVLDGGLVKPNTLRPMVRGEVKPSRIGAFTRRACLEGLIAPSGDWQTSDDREGHNAGRPMRTYQWTGASA